MNKQFVTYEIALKLKELDFDEKCFGWFNEKGELMQFPNCNVFWNKNSEIAYNRTLPNLFRKKKAKELMCTAPLWQQAVAFLAEKYNIIISAANEVEREQQILKAIEIVNSNS